MADEFQLSLLKQSAKAWNEGRREHRLGHVDLRNADLTEARFIAGNASTSVLQRPEGFARFNCRCTIQVGTLKIAGQDSKFAL